MFFFLGGGLSSAGETHLNSITRSKDYSCETFAQLSKYYILLQKEMHEFNLINESLMKVSDVSKL